jgi:AsmA protein
LVNEQINYQLTLQRSHSNDEEALDSKDIKNTLVPVKISGTFAEPNVSLDVKAMVMNTQKAQIEEQKEVLKKKITEKINEKLKGPAGELLKSLF